MPAQFDFVDRTAVVTGAASGIGAALAHGLAARGCRLALADIDRDGLDRVAASIGIAADRVSLHQLDVSDRQAIEVFPEAVRLAHGGAGLLFNNAGVALGGKFEDVSEADFDWLMSINFWGVVRMTRAFMPMLHEASQAHITNISSLFGLVAPAGQTAYSASKFAVRGFSDALRHELAGSSIGVTTVHPGGIKTAIARNARHAAGADPEELAKGLEAFEKLLVMPPECAAEIILRAVARRRPRVLVGRDAHLMAWVERLFPAHYWSLIGRKTSPEPQGKPS
ncbi:SDR family NAD(P)-dependent oxidoreductase [uncultured Maricaulis sp.]|uniref:SDR family NAD(P)-dependent oxidoreductase n=1 Tax=uncultured Maricaulis sp. TaxID=174710 RepID=UPI0030DD0162|tara:strand:+ start:56717 stop:57559 length:843 start_codon:yes stop_codon:yes gene_type:complete